MLYIYRSFIPYSYEETFNVASDYWDGETYEILYNGSVFVVGPDSIYVLLPRDMNLYLGGKLTMKMDLRQIGFEINSQTCRQIDIYLGGNSQKYDDANGELINNYIFFYVNNSNEKTYLPAAVFRKHAYLETLGRWATVLNIKASNQDFVFSSRLSDKTHSLEDMIWDGSFVIASPTSFIIDGNQLKSLFRFSPFLDVVSRIESLYLLDDDMSYFISTGGSSQLIRRCEIRSTGQQALSQVDAVTYEDIQISIFEDSGGITVKSISQLSNSAFYISIRASDLDYAILMKKI